MDDGAGGCWRLQMRVDGGRATQKGAHPEIQAAEGAAMRRAGKETGMFFKQLARLSFGAAIVLAQRVGTDWLV